MLYSGKENVIRIVLGLLGLAFFCAASILLVFSTTFLVRLASVKTLDVDRRIGSLTVGLESESKRFAGPGMSKLPEAGQNVRLENAIVLADADTIVLALRGLSSEDQGGKSAEIRERASRVASDLFAERARKRRFECDQLNTELRRIDQDIAKEPTPDILSQKQRLQQRRNLLLAKYPIDAQNAVDLNPQNARALYDLFRYMQDRPGSYNPREMIDILERVVKYGRNKFDKDADFLRANLNLAVTHAQARNDTAALCYSAQTLEGYLARSKNYYEYLIGKQPDGSWNEPEFMDLTLRLNPSLSRTHEDCSSLKTTP
ncbi:MAG: hypothetical protein WBO10_00970 [Pyrinomonadaceae bacterium]